MTFTHSEISIPGFLTWQTTLHFNIFFLFREPNQQFRTKPSLILRWPVNSYYQHSFERGCFHIANNMRKEKSQILLDNKEYLKISTFMRRSRFTWNFSCISVPRTGRGTGPGGNCFRTRCNFKNCVIRRNIATATRAWLMVNILAFAFTSLPSFKIAYWSF